MTVQFRDLPLFAPADLAKMTEAKRRILAFADGEYRSKETWADLAGINAHAFSARLSELCRDGLVTKERRPPRPGSGEVCGSWYYRLTRS